MIEDSELWRQVAIAERLIESAHVAGMAREEARHRIELGACYNSKRL
jgi:hypothetical protein